MTADEKPVDAERTVAEDADETVDTEEPTERDETAVDGDEPSNSLLSGETKPRNRRVRRLVALATASLVIVLSLGLLGWLAYFWYFPDREVDAGAARAAIAAASEGAVATLSYGPENLDNDLSSAKSHLTGEFLKYYTQFTDSVLKPAVREKSVKSTAIVLRAALQTLNPDKAVALLFINQTTQSKDKPEPSYMNSSVTITLTKVDGKWLISELAPL
ncbi:twin-arginine translocation pathway signal [Mycobacterium sp. Marseille-P9652]|uniref:twin-arginine translocation pathway signal n=1 Tax=Mycobacterium sp. Marseille-P9652 TaxID=2654950 RepID=UPI0012E8DFFA|nr:twin-arginine translocation pathway signal [Mycobacterium sp. Marseille-P9652]